MPCTAMDNDSTGDTITDSDGPSSGTAARSPDAGSSSTQHVKSHSDENVGKPGQQHSSAVAQLLAGFWTVIETTWDSMQGMNNLHARRWSHRISSLKPDSLETIVGDMYVQKHFVDLIVSLSGLALDAQEYSRTWCAAVTSANFAQLPGRRCTPASFREPGVPTIMTASSDMELERETSRSGPGKYVLRQPKRGGLLKTYLSIQHLPSKKSICPGQQIPKRVRFVGVPAHDSDPGDTRLIRGRTEHCVEDQHGRSSVATDERTEWSAGMKYERKAQGPFAGWLVSQGTIITLDGEEYVEYRVLVKPAVYSHSLRGSSVLKHQLGYYGTLKYESTTLLWTTPYSDPGNHRSL
ncbi:hypothetical protein PCL_08621 [Purpureocillium lilacinum]|uniref:Uncharacterized protein n=1 Tax=Purpureocillium lilacinum TaxID=33203 RepID=A0A2U3DR72_PURLI|nr:hypothetical protein PCL_08621 [Purpureocillium lilacinum]